MISRAAHARLTRLRSGEEGFALVFVLLLTTVIMVVVTATLAVVTPNITSARADQDAQAALAAAQAGIDDFVAYLTSTAACRSTSQVCAQALGADSEDLGRSQLSGTGQHFHWRSDTSLTADYDVRVHSTGTASGQSRTLVADVALQRGILSFGYYTNYESQSPDFLYQYFAGRHVYLSNSSTYGQVNAYDTRGRTVSVSSPTTVYWNGPPSTGTNPNPASMCGQHWYYESASSPGRYSYGSDPVWGETGTVGSQTVMRTSSCDVVFTTGMTFDGPIYSRDALLISDQTRGGVGPIFNQEVLSLWGYRSGSASYATPAPPASPWRQDDYAGGQISSQSRYSPATATFDLQLPSNIGTEGLPDDYCVYTGPTRVKLNGNGTATITSPGTTSRDAASDPDCYPTGSLSTGIVNFTLDYKDLLSKPTLYVKDLGTEPNNGWATTQNKANQSASQDNSVFWLTNSGGATAPDQPDSSVASDSNCSSSIKYKNTASYPCAWTNVATTTDVGTGSGWSAYSPTTKCNTTIAATNRQLFECEYSHTTGSTTPPSNQYGALRSRIQSDLSSGTCLTGSAATQADCLAALTNARLQTANTSGHAANYSSPANGDHRYIVTAESAGTPSTGTPQSVGSTPTAPMTGDSLFTSTSSAAQEAATKTPITLTVSRQTYGCSVLNLVGVCVGVWQWQNSTPQFTFTTTQSKWSITTPASATSYFPTTADVTPYAMGSSGANSTVAPGDVYLEGDDQGKLSVIAQHDVVVTGDVKDTSSNAADDAVDIVAGHNVRNYHPVKCVDSTASDLTSTSAGWCPNDITGLYRGALENNGVLTSSHPAMQYSNLMSVGDRRIDAAVFALSGSFMTDNYNRGAPLGDLTVNGGLYQSHRGANGVQWEYKTGDTKRATSGYSLQYHYVDLEHTGLPYTPPVNGDSNGHIWSVVSISSAGSS